MTQNELRRATLEALDSLQRGLKYISEIDWDQLGKDLVDGDTEKRAGLEKLGRRHPVAHLIDFPMSSLFTGHVIDHFKDHIKQDPIEVLSELAQRTRQGWEPNLEVLQTIADYQEQISPYDQQFIFGLELFWNGNAAAAAPGLASGAEALLRLITQGVHARSSDSIPTAASLWDEVFRESHEDPKVVRQRRKLGKDWLWNSIHPVRHAKPITANNAAHVAGLAYLTILMLLDQLRGCNPISEDSFVFIWLTSLNRSLDPYQVSPPNPDNKNIEDIEDLLRKLRIL